MSKESFENTYTYAVDHTTPAKQTHDITITPHPERVKFFDNGAETEIWSYGTGLAPLVIRAKKMIF